MNNSKTSTRLYNPKLLLSLLFFSVLGIILKLLDVQNFKILLTLMLVLILSALGSAFIQLVTKKGNSTSLLKSLTWRIALSAFLFAFLMLGSKLGWIQPHSLTGTINNPNAIIKK